MAAVAMMPTPAPLPTDMQLDFELSSLLDSLSLQQKARESAASEPAPKPTADDVQMCDEESSQGTQSATTASSSSCVETPSCCGLLKSITSQYETYEGTDDYATTAGAYLDLILIHRELFATAPREHEGCPAAFTALAHALEHRAWRADRDADTEAVAAYRHEAWMIAAWMTTGGMWWGPSRSE
ncbi:hypothetical protein DENSPDRAFT_879673 [Dentipellis sp. KUC8613]|nr:hypothetical protein DENSPDRAFT_879673 [Dentipellis sp. KUC8613]